MKDTPILKQEFDDNQLLSLLVGPHDQFLKIFENKLGIDLILKGNTLIFRGDKEKSLIAKKALNDLYKKLKSGDPIDESAIHSHLTVLATQQPKNHHENHTFDKFGIVTKKRTITPRSNTQTSYVKAMEKNDLVFGLGPAGTGKTYLAVAMAVSYMLKGKIDRILLSRPAVEAGEKLGFLPGDMKDKVDPYLRPLYDALHDMLPAEEVDKMVASGQIEVAPLAFMRGRTLSNSFIILDEAQNTTSSQMKMFLTRLGHYSKMVITGDMSQIDLPKGVLSGLKDATRTLKGVQGIHQETFSDQDVIRHPLVGRIVKAYDVAEESEGHSDPY